MASSRLARVRKGRFRNCYCPKNFDTRSANIRFALRALRSGLRPARAESGPGAGSSDQMFSQLSAVSETPDLFSGSFWLVRAMDYDF